MNEGLLNEQTSEYVYDGINILYEFLGVKLFSNRTVNELLSGKSLRYDS